MKNFILSTITLILSLNMTWAQEDKPEKITMKPALLVIDVQNQFIPMMAKENQETAIPYINGAIWVFRQFDLPVIRVYHTSDQWGPVPGTEEFEFPDTIRVTANDPMITKTYGSAFNKTELNELLKKEGINTLFMCGLSSVGCVLATYMDASNYDYEAFLIKDALLGPDADYTDTIEEIFSAMDLNIVYYMMKIRRE